MLFLIFVCFVSACAGSRVLMVFSAHGSSSALADSLLDALFHAGYEVTYVTPYPKEIRPNLTHVDVSSVLDHIQDTVATNEADVPEDASSPRYLPVQGARFARQLLAHPAMLELMMSSAQFDAVLVEWFYTGLLAPLAAVFECPLIWYTPTDISWQNLGLVADTPAHRLDLPPSTLVERAQQMWSQTYLSFWNYLYISRIEIPTYEKIYRQIFEAQRRALPHYESVVNDGSLLLVNSHPALGPAVSLPGNVKYIGGHHISKHISSLPKNLKKVMDSSDAGVIYVNVESDLVNTNLQHEVARELKEVFGDVEQTVIWKSDDLLVNLPHNVYTMRNPPQHSILSHNNTIAFISHGDMVSVLDATYFGIPTVALPLLEHHAANVNMMLRRGCGIRMEPDNLAWQVKKSVKAILDNGSYLMNAKRVKAIFGHRLTSPQQEFTHWVDAVIRARGAAPLRPAARRATALERHNLDVVLLLIMCYWFLTKVVKVIRVHLYADVEPRVKED